MKWRWRHLRNIRSALVLTNICSRYFLIFQRKNKVYNSTIGGMPSKNEWYILVSWWKKFTSFSPIQVFSLRKLKINQKKQIKNNQMMSEQGRWQRKVSNLKWTRKNISALLESTALMIKFHTLRPSVIFSLISAMLNRWRRIYLDARNSLSEFSGLHFRMCY